MPSIFWIGVGFAALICFVSALIGARSSSSSFTSGAAIGAFMGFMLAFPLIAIGLSSS
ncbi:MAG: hypothetical protein JST08_03375 [Actinobacteria bacterium]|nr:hypothetical protein [Actinomycetota bacterium]